MTKRFKYFIALLILFLVIFFIIAFMVSVETSTSCDKIDKNTYIFSNLKQFQPFNYNIDSVFSVWFTGMSITFILIYISFINKKEKNINKAQKFILATIVPVIIFISFLTVIQLLGISTLKDAWFFTVVMLILMTIFEYDLFGNKTIISFFDFKLLTKSIIFSVLLFFIIGILGELIPPFIFTKTTTKEMKSGVILTTEELKSLKNLEILQE